MNFLPKVRAVQAIRDELKAVDFEGLKGRSLAETIYVLRDIAKHTEAVEKGDKKKGIRGLRDDLRDESTEMDGVYEFRSTEYKDFDKKRFFILLSERFDIPSAQIDALVEECSPTNVRESLVFGKKYHV